MNEYIYRALIPGKNPVSYYSVSFEPILKLAIRYGGLFYIYKDAADIANLDDMKNDNALMILHFSNKVITEDHIESVGSDTFTGKPGLIQTQLLNQIYNWLRDNFETFSS